MSHVSFVQQELPFPELSPRPLSGSLLSIGMLGGEGSYTMPRAILEALAAHLGGMVTTDLPPFLVACADGLALILTLAVGEDYVGAAFVLPSARLSLIDVHLDALWRASSKGQTTEEFFAGTPFKCVGRTSQLPASIEKDWRRISC
jgi:hypothetical protein